MKTLYTSLPKMLDFLLEVDKLKTVQRQVFIHQGERPFSQPVSEHA